jgi:hypothetical protein
MTMKPPPPAPNQAKRSRSPTPPYKRTPPGTPRSRDAPELPTKHGSAAGPT